MKTTDITAIVLCAAGIFSPFIQSASAETRAGEGTRIDYINAKGERFWSTIAEPGYVYFKIHGNEDGYNVFCPQTMDENSTPVRIRFVRPGEENHSLTVSSENDNVKVSYEVIEGGDHPRRRIAVWGNGQTVGDCSERILSVDSLS